MGAMRPQAEDPWSHQKLQGARQDSLLEALEGAWLWKHLDFRLTVSRTVKKILFCFPKPQSFWSFATAATRHEYNRLWDSSEIQFEQDRQDKYLILSLNLPIYRSLASPKIDQWVFFFLVLLWIHVFPYLWYISIRCSESSSCPTSRFRTVPVSFRHDSRFLIFWPKKAIPSSSCMSSPQIRY